MKKILFGMLILLIAIGITACASADTPEATEAADSAEASGLMLR